jgi:hypothetical protein
MIDTRRKINVSIGVDIYRRLYVRSATNGWCHVRYKSRGEDARGNVRAEFPCTCVHGNGSRASKDAEGYEKKREVGLASILTGAM